MVRAKAAGPTLFEFSSWRQELLLNRIQVGVFVKKYKTQGPARCSVSTTHAPPANSMTLGVEVGIRRYISTPTTAAMRWEAQAAL